MKFKAERDRHSTKGMRVASDQCHGRILVCRLFAQDVQKFGNVYPDVNDELIEDAKAVAAFLTRRYQKKRATVSS